MASLSSTDRDIPSCWDPSRNVVSYSSICRLSTRSDDRRLTSLLICVRSDIFRKKS